MSFIDRWDRRPYFQRLGDAASQFVNVALLNGMTDESISGRCWRGKRAGKLRWRIVWTLVEFLFYPIDRGQHCATAFNEDVERSRLRWLAIQEQSR